LSRVLVTGAGGLVGSALVATGEVKGLSHSALDICKTDDFERALDVHQPAFVINAAALANVDRADGVPDLAAAVNGHAPTALALVAARHGVRFVHLSTDYVLDGPQHHDLSESMTPNPKSTYARSKLMGECGVLDAGGVVVRLQWVYQPNGGGFFNHALAMMARGERIRLVTDQIGCPSPASLVAKALLVIAKNQGTGIFHLATGGEATAFEWIEAGAFAAGIPLLADAAKRADFDGAHRPARSVLNCDRLATDFGLRLPHWRTALQTVMPDGDAGW